MRAQWLKTRQQFLAHIKRQVQNRLGPAPRDLSAYVRRYNSEFARPWKKSSFQQLLREISGSDVVLGADFHAFSQSQRIHLRLLRDLPVARPVILALEALSVTDQAAIDRFVAGRWSEEKFLTFVQWERRWGFPFDNYRPLFELARERGFQVVGLDGSRSKIKRSSAALPARDRFSAQLIGEWRREEPTALIYVVVGDLHLASKHLPAAIAKQTQGDKVLTVLQNSEHLYFRLAKTGKEQRVDVLRAKGGRFCVLGSPPWVKWQSYLMYLEQTYDHDLESGEMDYTDYVASYAGMIARDLGLQLNFKEIAVTTASQPQAWRRVQRKLSPHERRMIAVLIQCDRSFYLPQSRMLYLSRASVNHAATLAGQYLHASLCGRRSATWDFPAQFEAQIWVEAVGFFSSKMVNHKRKADRVADLKTQLDKGSGARSHEVLRLALSQRLRELTQRSGSKKGRPKSQSVYLEAARIVGHMMGDRLYQGLIEKRISTAQLVRWLKHNPARQDFAECYYEIVEEIEVGRRAGAEL